MASVLVTGGGGYIGSTVSHWLIDKGHTVFVIDDFSTGKKELVPTESYIQSKVGDPKQIEDLLKYRKFDCVMHLAAKAVVAESFERAQEYFENNVTQTEKFLELLIKSGVKKFVFSSSCSVFGEANSDLIDESYEKKPISPYGESKLKIENHLRKLSAMVNLECIVLRFFNAAGSEPKLRTGEWHNHETRLIPLALKAAREQSVFSIFGDDYQTPDKTCIRDFVHVWDLAQAHELALKRLLSQNVKYEDYNIGSEKGFSVREILNSVEKVSGVKLKTQLAPRRKGDPAKMVASSEKAMQVLGYSPRFSDLESMVRSAWDWDRKLNKN